MNGPASLSRELRVLLMPATRRDGAAIGAFLRRQGLCCLVCGDAALAAKSITEDAGALVLTDQALVADGFHLIVESLSSQPSWSDISVVVLSKVGDESRAMSEIVNRMTNVTLLDRPASTRTLLSTI